MSLDDLLALIDRDIDTERLLLLSLDRSGRPERELKRLIDLRAYLVRMSGWRRAYRKRRTMRSVT